MLHVFNIWFKMKLLFHLSHSKRNCAKSLSMHILCVSLYVNNLPLAIRQCPLDLRHIRKASNKYNPFGINALFSILVNICSHALCPLLHGHMVTVWQVAVSDCEYWSNVSEDVIRLCVWIVKLIHCVPLCRQASVAGLSCCY